MSRDTAKTQLQVLLDQMQSGVLCVSSTTMDVAPLICRVRAVLRALCNELGMQYPDRLDGQFHPVEPPPLQLNPVNPDNLLPKAFNSRVWVSLGPDTLIVIERHKGSNHRKLIIPRYMVIPEFMGLVQAATLSEKVFNGVTYHSGTVAVPTQLIRNVYRSMIQPTTVEYQYHAVESASEISWKLLSDTNYRLVRPQDITREWSRYFPYNTNIPNEEQPLVWTTVPPEVIQFLQSLPAMSVPETSTDKTKKKMYSVRFHARRGMAGDLLVWGCGNDSGFGDIPLLSSQDKNTEDYRIWDQLRASLHNAGVILHPPNDQEVTIEISPETMKFVRKYFPTKRVNTRSRR